MKGCTYSDGTSVQRTYTDRGQLFQLKHAGPMQLNTVIDTRTYDNGGRMTGSSYNNGVSESRSYDSDNTLSSISYSGASIGNLSYSWDNNKNRTAETITGTMSNYGFSIPTSGYNSEDRLVTFNRTSGLNQSWSLSPVGDWNSLTTNGTSQARTHGPTHELTAVAGSAVSTDVKGNMTLIPSAARPDNTALGLSWDMDNRLKSADVGNNGSTEVTYQFDALGRRVARSVLFPLPPGGEGQGEGVTTIYVQSGQRTIADYTSGANSSSPLYRYVYGSYIDEPVLRYQPTGAQSVYFHRNQQYSVTALTSASGAILERYAYTAYGTPTIANASGTILTSSAQNNRYTYTGREWDQTISLYHYRARMYDASLGRFCSKDPIGYADGRSLYSAYFSIWLKSVDALGLAVDDLGPCFEPWDGGVTFGHLIDEDGLAGMPWQHKDLTDPIRGRTDFKIRPTCECKECCSGWFVEHLDVDIDIWIEIDLDDGRPWDYIDDTTPTVEGTYGHEQRHAQNIMRKAELFYSAHLAAVAAGMLGKNYGKGGVGELMCKTACSTYKVAAVGWREPLKWEAGHDDGDTQEPYKGTPYPPFGNMPRAP
ncbi:MAG: hypothetical protein Aurels2KO_30680 [Aureliella sp.]